MAGELILTYAGTKTVYAVIQRPSDGSALLPAGTLTTWVDGDIGDYAQTMTAKGGGLYLGDFPVAGPIGQYRIQYREQAGSSPDIADLILPATQERNWNGAILVSGGSVTLSQYALTNETDLKRYLRITTTADDDLIRQIINSVSRRLERLCNRRFVARNYRERYSASRERLLVLNQYPVLSVDRMAFGRANCISLVFSNASYIRAIVESVSGQDGGSTTAGFMRLQLTDVNGVQTNTDYDYGTYQSTAALATAVNLAGGGWSALVQANVPTADLNPMAGQVGLATQQTVWLTYPDYDSIGYTVDYNLGEVTFAMQLPFTHDDLAYGWRYPRGHMNYLVQYRAGYEPSAIPEDLALTCIELCQASYYAGRVNPMMQSEDLGGYSYSLANRVSLSDAQDAVVAQYKRIAVGGAYYG